MCWRRLKQLIVVFGFFCLSFPVFAVDSMTVHVAELSGNGWVMHDVQLGVSLTAQHGPEAVIQIGRIDLPAMAATLKGLTLRCPQLNLALQNLSCRGGELHVADWRGSPLQGRVDLTYQSAGRRLHLNLADMRIAQGRVTLDMRYDQSGWRVDFTVKDLDVAEAGQAFPVMPQFAVYRLAGKLAGQGWLVGHADRIENFSGQLQLLQAGFSDASGLHAAESMGLQLALKGGLRNNTLTATTQLAVKQGALVWGGVYLEFNAYPFSLDSAFTYDTGTKTIRIQGARLQQDHVLQAALTGRIGLRDGFSADHIDLQIDGTDMQHFGELYLAPQLAGTAFANATLAGEVRGRLQIDNNRLDRVALDMHRLDWNDPGQRLSLHDVAGQIAWDRAGATRHSRLQWQSGKLFGFDLGAASIKVDSQGLHYWLAEPADIGILDGRLLVDNGDLTDPGLPAMQWSIDAVLTPLSMSRVAAALNWPDMRGKLSGVVPDVQYRDGRITVGGMLLVRAFDGMIKLQHVALEQPFGLVPRLQADIDLEHIDLEQLTGTFAFGKIEGRLGGYVHDLRMQDWQPVAFDAVLATSADDDSRHRISQRAVDNLSRIGGGVGQALSQTFLGFFKEFPYDRLGISCRLQNGVCEMGGVAPAADGYYLVKGRWLPPRIDIVGFAHRVDWDTLVARLAAATAGGSPTVQ